MKPEIMQSVPTGRKRIVLAALKNRQEPLIVLNCRALGKIREWGWKNRHLTTFNRSLAKERLIIKLGQFT